MRYAGIDRCDLCNGLNIGTSLYVQGCNAHCKGCFNSETWDFNGGKEWNEEAKKQFLTLVDRPYIKRITILGGEPLAYGNLCGVYDIVKTIRTQFPDKKIWLYTGYTLSCGIDKQGFLIGDFADADTGWDNGLLRNQIIRLCDVIVDGAYIDELRDLSLPFRGSSNQRLIDVKETIKAKRVILYNLKSE